MPERTTTGNLINNMVEAFTERVSENPIAENLLSNVVEKLSHNVDEQRSMSFFGGDSSGPSRMNRLFGRQKPVHTLLGGGQSADLFLWRNKKISSGVLVGATAVWILFEWLNYNLLTFACMALAVGMLVQFVWSNAVGLLNRSPSEVPRLCLPNELFVDVAVNAGKEVNRFLGFLQDVATGGNIKQFLAIVASLWAAAIIGSWCNFLTVIYIGFVAAQTLPVLYEKYEDQVDNFLENLFGQFQNHYKKVNTGVFSKIPKGKLKWKKFE